MLYIFVLVFYLFIKLMLYDFVKNIVAIAYLYWIKWIWSKIQTWIQFKCFALGILKFAKGLFAAEDIASHNFRTLLWLVGIFNHLQFLTSVLCYLINTGPGCYHLDWWCELCIVLNTYKNVDSATHGTFCRRTCMLGMYIHKFTVYAYIHAQ